MIQIKLDLEKICIVLFFVILLFIGPGSLFDHKIVHEFPYGYFASDAFQHQVRAEAIKDAGNFRYEQAYISVGFEKTVGRYPPLIYHLAVIFANTAGIQVYDAIYFVLFFFAIISILVMYLIIRDFNKNIALISLPLSILTFTHPNLIGFTWGHWPSVLAQSFLIVFFWFIMKIDLGYFCIPAALIFSAVLLTHTSEGVFGFIFAVLFFCIKFIGKNLKKSQIIYVTICLVLAFIISLHYLIIFQNTWGDNKYQFLVEPIWNGNPGFYIMDFKVLLIFIIAGILFSLFKMKDMHIALIAAIAMLISGFLNYIGFGLRSFQIRFFWPVYLAVFFGFGLYMLLKFAMKSWNLYYSVLFFFIFIVLLINFISIPIIPQYKKTTSQGIMDPYHWSILKWIEDKSEPNARVYFFYGDIYSQDAVLRNSKRLHHLINIEDFVNAIKDKKIKRIYISKLPGDAGGGLKIRQGLFKFKDLSREVPLEYYLGPQDICKFDYLVFDKVSRQQALAQYNLLIANELLRKEFIEKAFENEIAIILKNNKIGADCIEERSF